MIIIGHGWFVGSVAWLVHRVTGIVLTCYLFAHLYVLSTLKDPEKFASLMGLLKHPLVKLSEVGLLAVVVAHTLNGVRLTLIDLGAPTRYQKPLFIIASLLSSIAVVYGSVVILGGAQ